MDRTRSYPPGSSLGIAFVVINYNRREGTSRAISEVASRLATRHDVHVFSRTAENVDLSRVTWHRIAGFGYPHIAEFLSFTLSASYRIECEAFDIVHAAGGILRGANVYGIHNIQPAKRRVLARLGPEERVSPVRRLTRWMYLTVSSWFESWCYDERWRGRTPIFLAVSSGVLRELKSCHRIGDSLAKVIPNGSCVETFRPRSMGEQMAFRAMVGLQQDDLVMVFSGGEWKRKGLDLAIRALQHILDRRVKLLVMGIDKAQGEFQNLARECGVTGRVVFAGFRSDVEAGLAASDLFLFPSWYEAFSVAMIEAAACGLPIVATRINGAEDFVKDEENGTFITNVPEEIARVVSSLVSNPDRLKEMGAAARATVVERFTWDRVARETEQAYFELLANRAGGTEQVTS